MKSCYSSAAKLKKSEEILDISSFLIKSQFYEVHSYL